MTDQSAESKISNIIKTIRSWSLLWDLDELLKEIIKNSVITLNADYGCLLLLESNGLTLKSQWPETNAKPTEYLSEIAEKVIRHGVAVYAHGLKQGQSKDSQVYCVPMTANRGVLGVIYVQSFNRIDEITADEKLIFEMLGLQAASFLENSVLYHSAITDPLTGLYSHRHFQLECDQMLRRAKRTQSQVTMMILDLDHFKQLNDSFGHEAGNICLKRISEILRNKFRLTDIIARFGGDEFEILLPDANTEKSVAIAQLLIEQIRNENFPLQISCTIGIANYPSHAIDSQSLFLAADQALYVGKKKGRNCAVVATTDINETKEKTINTLTSNALRSKDEPTFQSAFPDHIKKDIQRIDGLDIVSRIASSSNGEIMLAKQHELDRFVALKRPLTAHLTEEQSNAFRKEAFITASLSHPGVVPLYTMGRGLDGRLYYTMKPIKGFSLADLLNKWKGKDSQTIKEYNLIKLIHILLKACETIAYAHSKDVVHLDIHPENIIIGEFGEITLIDWGKGKNLKDPLVETKANGVYISGSPIYRAPEQLKSDRVGKFTDVYSLGIILFEILTDKTPFKMNSTKETIDAITKGINHSEYKNFLNYGIDPLLAKACLASINSNPLERISASDLSNALSRFAMLEADVKVHLFNTSDSPMRENEWHNIFSKSKWALKDGVWSTLSNFEQQMLYWIPPITGNFSFTCEGWITEYPRELGIVCYGKSVKDTTGWHNRKEMYKGYCFQFGADNNLYTKLARHADDILVDANYTIEPNRKYLITISYQDGWLHCYIDKALVFNYRELHPFSGHHLGFYSYGNGSHFRPIEVRYQTTGLMAPAIRLADEHMTSNRFEVALSLYNEIIKTYPDRLEGYESILKKGFCCIKLNRPKEALQEFERLKGTILEPYALTEIAMMELPANEYEITQKEGDYKKAFSIFSSLIEKFPRHQAIFRILLPCHLLRLPFASNNITFKKNREEALIYKKELLRLASETLSPPGQSQIICFGGMLSHLMLLGHWSEALAQFKNMISKYKKYLELNTRTSEELLQLAYSCDEWNLIEKNFDSIFSRIVYNEIYPIIIIEKLDINIALEKLNIKKSKDIWKDGSTNLILNLSLKRDTNLSNIFEGYFQNSNNYQKLLGKMRQTDFLPFEMLIAKDKNEMENISKFLFNFSKESNEHIDEAFILKHYFLAISDLFNFDLYNCFKNINESNTYVSKIHLFHEKRLILTSLLYDLEYEGDLNKEELYFQNKLYLVGPRLELANNFLKGEIFTFSDKWPKNPTSNYFDRVLYCIWLYEKGAYALLSTSLKTIIKPNLGDSYFQPFLIKLEEKLNQQLSKLAQNA